jgi:hypothetical protein
VPFRIHRDGPGEIVGVECLVEFRVGLRRGRAAQERRIDQRAAPVELGDECIAPVAENRLERIRRQWD